MKLNHILTAVALLTALGTNLIAGAPAMCGAAPTSGENPAPPVGKSSVQKSADALVAQLAPERQSDLLILLNEATEDRLVAIKGIAPTRAAAIIHARPISSLSELVGLKGIGLTTLSRILAYDPNAPISTGPATTTEAMTKQES